MILADGGRVLARTLKRELPNYGTFDEKRVFASGPLPEPIDFQGVKIGVPICEDIWQEVVCSHLADAGAEFLLVPNGSPYELDKDDNRAKLVRSRVMMTGLPLAYLNRVGGQDELVFDGSSFIMHPDGERVVQFPDWEEKLILTEWKREADGWRCATRESHDLDPFPEDVYRAMIVGLRDYVTRNGFPGVILGLSGGIDSALSAAVAVDALGPDKVWGVMLPSKYTSDESLEDARGCARLLGCRHDVISIEGGVAAFDGALAEAFEDTKPGLAEENIQARLRMVALMALVEQVRADAADHRQQERDERRLCHALRRHVRRLQCAEGRLQDDGVRSVALAQSQQAGRRARPRRAGHAGERHHQAADRRASARPEGRGQPAALFRSRPDPRGVDRQGDVGPRGRSATGEPEELVAKMEQLVLRAEYKRRQAPPGVKIGVRNFGRDRRYPISNFFHTGLAK